MSILLGTFVFEQKWTEVDLSALFILDEEGTGVEDEEDDAEGVEEPEQIGHLATFSSVASSFWKNLLNYETIRQRNRPDESALKKSVTAPFFLPQLAPTLNVRFIFFLLIYTLK